MGFFGIVWKWIKRILFIAAMSLSVMSAIVFFESANGTRDYIINIFVIVLAVVNCVLYFIFADDNRWTIALGLIAQFVLEIILVATNEDGGMFFVGIAGTVVGLFMPFNVREILNFSENTNKFLGGN